MSVSRHTAYNLAGAILPLVVTLVTLPLYLGVIGDARYGVLAILWTLLGYMGLFDLGLGQAVNNRIAALRAATSGERAEVVWTALLLNLAVGLAGGAVLWAVGAVLFGRFLDVPGLLTHEVQAALPWMAAAFPLLLTTSVLSGALMGREEFLATNAVRIGEGVLVQAVPLAVAVGVGHSLPELVVAVLSVRLLSGAALLGLCYRRLPMGLRPVGSRAHVRPLLVYGGWVTVTSIVGPLLSTMDRVLIGAVAGVRAVTYYTVPFSLASRLSILPGSLASALFPRFSSPMDVDERRRLMASAMRTVAVALTPLVVVAVLLARPALVLWLGEDFALRSATVGEILLVGVWINCLAYVPYHFLQATGRPGFVARLHLLETVPYLVLLWLALGRYGIVGAAVVWTLRVAADTLVLCWASGTDRRAWIQMGQAGLLVLGAAAVVSTWDWTAWPRWAASAVLVPVTAAWAWRQAPGTLRQAVLGRLASTRSRFLSPTSFRSDL